MQTVTIISQRTGKLISNLPRKSPYLKEIMIGCSAPESKPIFVNNYPGTVNGCNCLDVSWSFYRGVRYRQLNQGTCRYNETRAGCREVPSTPSRELTWFNSRLCGVFGNSTENFSSMMANMHKRNGTCRAGFTKCGNEKGISQGICLP